MLAGPATTPVTMPVAEPIVIAAPGVVQFPPVTPSLSVVVAPVHTVDDPVMADGVGLTVIVFVAAQPDTV